MITRLVWTTWTPVSAVPKRAVKLNHSRTLAVTSCKHGEYTYLKWQVIGVNLGDFKTRFIIMQYDSVIRITVLLFVCLVILCPRLQARDACFGAVRPSVSPEISEHFPKKRMKGMACNLACWPPSELIRFSVSRSVDFSNFGTNLT